MLWIAMLMAHDKDSNVTFVCRVDHRVRKVPQRENAAPVAFRRPEAWVLDEQPGHALKLVDETAGELGATFAPTEPGRFE
jgi:hypothetical protein